MRNSFFQGCLLVAGLTFATVTARAQEVVHALTGTVTSVSQAQKTFLVATDDDSEGNFTTAVKPGVSLDFPKDLRAETTPAASFNKTSTRVLVYYIGDNSVRTAIAVQDLGPGPFVKTVGTVFKVDRHAHLITVQPASGAPQSFHIDGKTIAEATEGVEPGEKFQADKGVRVRVIAIAANGASKALFIRSF